MNFASQVFSVALTAPANLKNSEDSDSSGANMDTSEGLGYNDSYTVTKKGSSTKKKNFNSTAQMGTASS